MAELITDEKFSDGQQQIAASNMNGIIGRARVQPDVIANKPASATLDVADQVLVLKTDNTLARGRFDTFVNSVSSTLPLADTTKNGMLRQVSGSVNDFVDGTNSCQPIANIIPPGVMMDYAGNAAAYCPPGWVPCDGRELSRTDFAALYNTIGGYYGSGDGSTTFNVPNFAGRCSIGVGGGSGGLTFRSFTETAGEESHRLTAAELGPHYHPWPAQGSHAHSIFNYVTTGLAAGGAQVNVISGNTASGAAATPAGNTDYAGGNGLHNNMSPYIAVFKIIKY